MRSTDAVRYASRRNFRGSAESRRFLGLPINSFAWLVLGLGIVLLAFGIVVLRKDGALAVGILAVLGLGMVVVPLAFSIPQKAGDAVKLRELGVAPRG